MLKAAACLVCLMATPVIAQQAELHLTRGKMSFSDGYITQIISVKNDSGTNLKAVQVECGFYGQNQLQAAGRLFINNLQAGQTGFDAVVAESNAAADRSDCRIVTAD